MNKYKKGILVFFGGILFFLFGLGVNPPALWAKGRSLPPNARLIRVEEQKLPARLRFILNTSRPVSPRQLQLSNSKQLAIDLSPCSLIKLPPLEVKDPLIEAVRFIQRDKRTVRVLFNLSSPAPHQVQVKKGTPFQIFVDFPKTAPRMAESPPKKTDQDLLPETTLEDFKKEKILIDNQEKEKNQKRNQKVSFDFYMTNLHNVLRVLGAEGGFNIVVNEDVKDKKITLSLKEVRWWEALDSILDSNNLTKIERGEKTYVITTNENYKKIRDEKHKEKMEENKLTFDSLLIEEQRKNLGKIPRGKRTFHIKNIDVVLVQNILREVEAKESIRGPKATGKGEIVTGTPGMGTFAGIGSENVGGIISTGGSGSDTPGVGSVTSVTTSKGSVTLISIPHTNTLLARGYEDDLDYIEELISAIDKPIPQVMIEARIVEADANFTRDLGIRWGGGYSFNNSYGPFAGTIRGGDAGGGTTGNNYAVNLPFTAAASAFGGLGFAFASTNLNIDARIQAMEKQGRGKTISSPKILTLDNKEATIKQGQSIPVTARTENNTFSTRYEDAALVLKVKPNISSSKKIRIHIKIFKNEPDFTKVDSLGNPAIKIKAAETEMMVNDGDTVAIGGILYKKETINENRIPILGDIPLMGWLFKSRYKNTEDTELLIFITPRIQKSTLSESFGNEN